MEKLGTYGFQVLPGLADSEAVSEELMFGFNYVVSQIGRSWSFGNLALILYIEHTSFLEKAHNPVPGARKEVRIYKMGRKEEKK